MTNPLLITQTPELLEEQLEGKLTDHEVQSLVFTLRCRAAPDLREGADVFAAHPVRNHNLGPWGAGAGSKEGDIEGLRLPYRLMITEQEFVLVHASSAGDAVQMAEEVKPQAVTDVQK